jgi:hypothetical protein
MQRVDLDVPKVELLCQLASERRLAASARTGDRDPRQSWNSPRATTTADPPTSIRSIASAVPSTRAYSVE